MKHELPMLSSPRGWLARTKGKDEYVVVLCGDRIVVWRRWCCRDGWPPARRPALLNCIVPGVVGLTSLL